MQIIEFSLIFRIASSYTDAVELYDFQSNKWESKNEWNYPFRNGRSFYHSTSVSLGDSVIIFGGYDHHGHEEYGHQKHQNLKNIGMVVIISNRES